MKCENCRWWKPAAAMGFDPKGERSALVNWLVDEGRSLESWPGKCAQGPIPEEVKSDYLCASWKLNRYFLQTINDVVRQRGRWSEEDRLRNELKVERLRSRERFRKIKALKAKP